jgi:hypothetical protein
MRRLLWLPRLLLGRIFRPVNVYFDQLEADVEFLVEKYREAHPK